MSILRVRFLKEKTSKPSKLKSFLIGGIVFSIFGALFGLAVKASFEGAIMGFFIGGWLSIEISMIIFAADYDKRENNK